MRCRDTRGLVLAVLLAGAWARVGLGGNSYFVSTNGTHGAGTDWASAFTNVQAAVDTAAPGDTIYVAGETFVLTNQVEWALTDVSMHGGYEFDSGTPGTVGVAPTVLTRVTGTTRLLNVDGATNAVFTRLTITGGQTDVSVSGGGVRIADSQQITFQDCEISNNQASSGTSTAHGGGVVIVGDSKEILFDRCTIRGNTARQAGWGGGIYINGASITGSGTVLMVTNSVIADNIGGHNAGGRGGGVGINGGVSGLAVVIVDTHFGGNRGRSWGNDTHSGYAIGMRYSSMNYLVRNCLFYGNTDFAGSAGQGVIRTQNDSPTVAIEHCTFVGNGRNIVNRGTGTSVTIRDSIVWDNIGTVGNPNTIQHSVTEAAGTGNIDADPLFERGVYLAAGSPAIGVGSKTVAVAGLTGYTTRADGTPAVGTDTVDMGYHHHEGINWSVADLYVKPGGSGDASGADATNALPSITAALALAGNGTRIHLAPGDYTTAHETFPLTVSYLHGIQFLGTDPETTVINTHGSGARAISVTRSANTRIANIGFTNDKDEIDIDGGAVSAAYGVLDVVGCVFSNLWIGSAGTSKRGGAALYATRGRYRITDCTIRDNRMRDHSTATYPTGAIFFSDDHHAVVDRCRFLNNTVTLNRSHPVQGAALSNASPSGHATGSLTVRNSLFVGNRRNVTANMGTTSGEAIFIYNYGTMYGTIENCTIVDSTLQAVALPDIAISTLRNTILWDNDGNDLSPAAPDNAVVTHNTIASGYKDGEDDNIATNPLFVDADARNYRLQPLSTSSGTGMPLGWMDADALDLDGEPRAPRGLVDRGAYQIQPQLKGTVIMFN